MPTSLNRLLLGTLSMLALAAASCSRSVYPVYGTARLDPAGQRVVDSVAGVSVGYGYDPTIAPESFVFPQPKPEPTLPGTTDNTAKSATRSGHTDLFPQRTVRLDRTMRRILREAGIGPRDTLFFAGRFMLCYVHTGAMRPRDFDTFCGILDRVPYSHTMQRMITPQNRTGWIYEKVRLNRRHRRYVVRHSIPWRSRWLCLCYVLESATPRNRDIRPRVYTTNYDATQPRNMIFTAEHFCKFLDSSIDNARRIRLTEAQRNEPSKPRTIDE